MAEVQTWRELLSMIIRDPDEKERIVKAAAINPVTLTRWIKQTSTPRVDNLRPLLDALPQYRQQLGDLISKEFPQLFSPYATQEERVSEISPTFYAHILSTYTSSPVLLREDLICTQVIQQMLEQLDPPAPQDVGAILALCVRPEPGQKVHSLCKVMGKASHYHGNDLESQIQFLGSESQTGHALAMRHPIVVQSLADHRRLFPYQIMGVEESTAAFPILLADCAAGVLTLASTQQNYFTQSTIDLVQHYVNLLVLAFTPESFYDLNMIELGMMPPRSIQLAYTADFQQRLTSYMIAQGNRTLTRPEAELILKRQVEKELLQLIY
ncbi:MAG: hypothetical protein NVS2B12_15220 [Ktedonobacteraceae bacterium]